MYRDDCMYPLISYDEDVYTSTTTTVFMIPMFVVPMVSASIHRAFTANHAKKKNRYCKLSRDWKYCMKVSI